jgi:hypothetical protein
MLYGVNVSDVTRMELPMLRRQVPPNQRRDLSVKEICFELSVARGWVDARLGTPEVPPYIRRGKFILFPRDLFLEWKKRQRVYGDLPTTTARTSNV